MGRVSAAFLLLVVAVFTTSAAESTATDRHGVSIKRFLRVQNEVMEAHNICRRRRMKIGNLARRWLSGRAEEGETDHHAEAWVSSCQGLTKLKVKNLNDKSFNSFARYYARYLIKYPKKAVSLPGTPEEAATIVKPQGWLKERVFPQQIGKKLEEFGQKDIKRYTMEYLKMWGSNQAKLSGQ